jgi:hypothetical protein
MPWLQQIFRFGIRKSGHIAANDHVAEVNSRRLEKSALHPSPHRLSGQASPPRDVTQLSNAELIETLARQARELGVQIDLSYDFAQPKKPGE